MGRRVGRRARGPRSVDHGVLLHERHRERPTAEMAQVHDDGWLRTGDVGALSKDGFLDLTDRAKDVIKSGGEWISSVDLENALMGHPSVREASVVGVPDEKWGERPLATVVVVEGQTVDPGRAARLPRRARSRKWQVPERWAFIDEVPKTSVGKFDKKVLRKRYADGELDVKQLGLGADRRGCLSCPTPPSSSSSGRRGRASPTGRRPASAPRRWSSSDALREVVGSGPADLDASVGLVRPAGPDRRRAGRPPTDRRRRHPGARPVETSGIPRGGPVGGAPGGRRRPGHPRAGMPRAQHPARPAGPGRRAHHPAAPRADRRGRARERGLGPRPRRHGHAGARTTAHARRGTAVPRRGCSRACSSR